MSDPTEESESQRDYLLNESSTSIVSNESIISENHIPLKFPKRFVKLPTRKIAENREFVA